MQHSVQKPVTAQKLAILAFPARANWQLAIPSLLLAFSSAAATFQDDFSSNPAFSGWRVFGQTNLFQWDSANQNLKATWDSSQPNSYFYHSLGTILTTNDAFSVEFDIQLSDVQYTNTFELGVGLLKLADATSPGFSRANFNCPNLFEFDYFPDDGFGEPNIAATLIDRDNDLYFIWDTPPMNLGVVYHVQLLHSAGETNIHGNVFTNGQLYTSMPKSFSEPTADFRVDTFSVNSYTTQDDTFGDSLLAHGTIDNVVVTLPPLPVQGLSGGFSNTVWRAQFTSQTNWLYTLMRTADLNSWTPSSPVTPGVPGPMVLSDTNPPPDKAFYRVRAERP